MTDASGNSTTATAQVTVVDLTAPTVTTKPATLTLNASGVATLAESNVIATKADNCGIPTVQLSKTSFDCSNVSAPTTVTVTVTDASGNSTTAIAQVTVVDLTAPSISAPAAVTINANAVGCTWTLVGAQLGTPVTSDNCSVTAVTNNAPSSFSLGTTVVTWTVTDASGNSQTATQNVTIVKQPTTLSLISTPSVQYSDVVTLTATLQANGSGISSQTVSFTAGTQSVTAVTNGSGVASTTLAITQAPGTYPVVATYAGACPYDAITSSTNSLTVTKENAIATYTGALFASTSGSNSSAAIVTLSATIQDITAVPSDPAYDPYLGDIKNATVTFRILETGQTIPATIGYVNPGDTKTGTATVNWSIDIGTAESKQFTVQVLVNGYYIGNDQTVVTISKPLNDFVTGGGYVVVTNSAGTKAATAGTKNNFGFNIKYNKSGKSLQGNINTIIRRVEDGVLRVYQIKGNVMTSLAVQNVSATVATAVFNGKANIQDITDPLNVISLSGNLSLQVNMTDRGEPGTADGIAITAWDKDGGLWFASEWNGVKTVEKTLGGGNLVIRGGNVSTTNAREAAVEAVSAETPMKLEVQAYPNPTSDVLNVTVKGAASDLKTVKLKLYDLTNRVRGEWPVNLSNGEGNATIDIRENGAGLYILSAEGDKGRATMRIMKSGN
ncbi:hypothetical protein GCM10023189_43590 [Nibrella saemangeumensis]|uniref:HYR domain-containing protein n=1 Tax=Nibrella saemangeumensis TaxID=1084526 RepID=A0ABP8NB80_9BACT